MNHTLPRLAAITFFILIPSLPTKIGATNYYIDSRASEGNSDGQSQNTAWRGVETIRGKKLLPGDSILFRRGGHWNNAKLDIRHSGTPRAPIVISAYGPGSQPLPELKDSGESVIGLYASHLVLENLSVSGARRYGVALQGKNTRDITIRSNTISGSTNGIIINGVWDVRIDTNLIHSISYNRSNNGGVGIILDRSRDVIVRGNRIRHCIGTENGKSDGGAIELFRSNQGIEITGNRAYDTWGFVEMGGLPGDTIKDIRIEGNVALDTRTLAWFNLRTPTDSTNRWGVAYRGISLCRNTFVQNRRSKYNALGANTVLDSANDIRVEDNLIGGDSLSNFIYKAGFQRRGNQFWTKSGTGSGTRLSLSVDELHADPGLRIDTTTLDYSTRATLPGQVRGAKLR